MSEIRSSQYKQETKSMQDKNSMTGLVRIIYFVIGYARAGKMKVRRADGRLIDIFFQTM